ncbi:MAG: hydantoinase/oxoprolinase family protein [Candidatus Thermoplasmatota archaeon]|nr:hydantoinase/oxoprolinase family protein [Candidatus Thermoplasmatota archaeon]
MIRAGVDVGGTFTDTIIFHEKTGKIDITKTPSTPDNPAEGILRGLEKADLDFSNLTLFSHGSTVGTNALITRDLPHTGLITTTGFRDVLEIGRATKEDVWDAYKDVAPPYVRRRDRLEVEERIDYDGTVVTPLNEDQARNVVRIFKKRGVKTIAISLINAYMNGAHEKRMRDIVEKGHPDAFVCCSHEILPEMFEHERTSTTVINAALAPVVMEYLTDLAKRLKAKGYGGDVLAMHSGGGVMTVEAMSFYASRIANSGPTAGAIAGAFIAQQCGFENAIGLDMGGTSTDVSLTFKGKVQTTDEWWVEYGYPIMFPSADIKTIGAGGGSVAWIDEGGALRVGPKSMGADPGPACYGKGGDQPTITDANLILNWLAPEMFLGGDMKIVPGLSKEVLQKRVADHFNMDLIDAAVAVEEIAVANISNAVGLVSTAKGFDPRDFVLVAFGGAGPLHAANVAKTMNIPQVIVPPWPGINSALGCLLVNIEHDLSQTFITPAEDDVVPDLERKFQEMEEEMEGRLEKERIAKDAMRVDRSLSMRYTGQWRHLSIPAARPLGKALKGVIEKFHQEHRRVHAYSDLERDVQIYGLRVTGKGLVQKPVFPKIQKGDAEKALRGKRAAYFKEEGGFVPTAVYLRSMLGAGARMEGPAIVEQMDSTIAIPPGDVAQVDGMGNIIITVGR